MNRALQMEEEVLLPRTLTETITFSVCVDNCSESGCSHGPIGAQGPRRISLSPSYPLGPGWYESPRYLEMDDGKRTITRSRVVHDRYRREANGDLTLIERGK